MLAGLPFTKPLCYIQVSPNTMVTDTFDFFCLTGHGDGTVLIMLGFCKVRTFDTVTTCLVKLEMLRNLTAVWERSQNWSENRAKYHRQNRGSKNYLLLVTVRTFWSTEHWLAWHSMKTSELCRDDQENVLNFIPVLPGEWVSPFLGIVGAVFSIGQMLFMSPDQWQSTESELTWMCLVIVNSVVFSAWHLLKKILMLTVCISYFY